MNLRGLPRRILPNSDSTTPDVEPYLDALADGCGVLIAMDFSSIDTLVIEVDGNYYSTDHEGRGFSHLSQEKVERLLGSDRSDVQTIHRETVPLPRARIDRHHDVQYVTCDVCATG